MVDDKNRQIFHVLPPYTEDLIRRAKPFWIHASSGEIEYARPVLRALRKQFPQVPLLVTYSSPSAKKMLSSLSEIAAWGPLPWDCEKSCGRFIARWQPRAFLVARTDVWPVIAETAKRSAIPSLLFSATFAENSSRLHGVSASVTQWALNQLSAIHCVSDKDVQELSTLKLATPVTVQGDTRFDQVFHRLENPRILKTELQPSAASPVLVAGSTWPEDEVILIEALKILKGTLRMILVPHEVDEAHLSQVETLLQNRGLSFDRYTVASAWSTDVLIVDQVGILAELYTWGQGAFVGGSFRKQVHSVMEPLAVGLPVFVGPYHRNNREALAFKEKIFSDHPAVTEVQTAEDLVQKLNILIHSPPSQFGKLLQTEMRSLASSTQAVIQWCEDQASPAE
jgi:3-deoxy-D-manno-octulosonic-acid transferase